ncbi:hypothetical protein ACJJTC_015178 [Scirpophaga incertulas]
MVDVKRYTLSEVAQNKGREGQAIWVVYKDSVYDVTNYIREHPGGEDTIIEEAGLDATKVFDSVGHTADAKTIMEKLKIGELVEHEKKYDENGKKKKKVVTVPPEKYNRSCINVITCGLLG